MLRCLRQWELVRVVYKRKLQIRVFFFLFSPFSFLQQRRAAVHRLLQGVASLWDAHTHWIEAKVLCLNCFSLLLFIFSAIGRMSAGLEKLKKKQLWILCRQKQAWEHYIQKSHEFFLVRWLWNVFLSTCGLSADVTHLETKFVIIATAHIQ